MFSNGQWVKYCFGFVNPSLAWPLSNIPHLRYDQSSINIIMESLLDRDGWNRTTINDDGGMGQFISIQREDRESKKLSIPCH